MQGANYGWPVLAAARLRELPDQARQRDGFARSDRLPALHAAARTGRLYRDAVPGQHVRQPVRDAVERVEGGQRVIRIDPRRVGDDDYAPEAFVTGLIRPVDVAVAPDGSLVVADSVYGHVWRVVYTG